MERARISANDLREAIWFINAALALEYPDGRHVADTMHRALEIAAIIYYARPFLNNEPPPWKAKRSPKGAPPIGKLEVDLPKVLPDKSDRALHRSVIRLRSKIVAHAESQYFQVRLVKSFTPGEDFSFSSMSTHPGLDLRRLRDNARRLANAFGFASHEAALKVMDERKRRRARKRTTP